MKSSILVQAADTYLHIATESENIAQIQSKDSEQHHYSRGLAPWCLNRPRIGSQGNVNYWGCGLGYDENINATYLNNFTL